MRNASGKGAVKNESGKVAVVG